MKKTLEQFLVSNESLSFFTEKDARTFYSFVECNNIKPAMLLLINELKKYSWFRLNTTANIPLFSNEISIQTIDKLLDARVDDYIVDFNGENDLGTNAFSGSYYFGDIFDTSLPLLVKDCDKIFTHMILALGTNKVRFNKATDNKLSLYLKDKVKEIDVSLVVLFVFLSLTNAQRGNSIQGKLASTFLSSHNIRIWSEAYKLFTTALKDDKLFFSRITLLQIRNINDYQLFVNKIIANGKLPALGNLLDIVS